MKPEPIVWNSSYTVGLNTVDNQHKRLVELINELGTCIENHSFNNQGMQIYFALLHFADTYLFKEKILAASIDEIDYSFFREKHNEFLGRLRAFHDRYIEENSEQPFLSLYEYLITIYPQYITYYTPSLVKILKNHGIQ